ncbi:alpha/beta-hydrolase [Massarina eburnea CBS 473.64]|uniref:Alpha/beta-hydrolase n=1 Tax=Massarina eburnea CBS 473.64 TaxID=1395130 RepID=A0A6A6RTR8_9PLEO|nr:alpha/beta-hydrolase [Massarina eburnea CBS 473.64]
MKAAARQYQDSQTVQASESSIHAQEQPYSSSPPAAREPHGYTTRSPPPQYTYAPRQEPCHPIYGPTPQMPQEYGQSYQSHADQSSQQYIGDSAVTITPPAKQSRCRNARANTGSLLRTHWNRAERMASRSCENLSNQISVDATNKSVTMVTTNLIVKPTTFATNKSVQALNQGAALCDRISDKFDAVMTSIDGGLFSGNEQDLYVYEDQVQNSLTSTLQPITSREQPAPAQSTSTNSKGSNFFSKVWLYSNARLPPHLPPFKVWMSTYPLICLAAKYSERAYDHPSSPSQSETHIKADWRSGTKAMILKSLPVDDMNTIVFAIRGSQTFMDWAVNYRTEPSSPEGFLDDAGNLCHSGFLYVARKMVKPVADRLRVLLEENPARSNASLLITGHSAGGAVAALLFAHMMNVQVQSELSYLTGFFKRIHCVIFGAPPVSLLPLKKSNDQQHRKSLFYSFINEGDPVPRIDRSVFKSLVRLYSTPAPNYSCLTTASLPAYPIPQCSLSPAGRLIVLRNKQSSISGMVSDAEEDIEAVTVDDDLLRSVVYGDPVKHEMRLYRKRVEVIATRAVTGADW